MLGKADRCSAGGGPSRVTYDRRALAVQQASTGYNYDTFAADLDVL